LGQLGGKVVVVVVEIVVVLDVEIEDAVVVEDPVGS
jgi:hypothetical protein